MKIILDAMGGDNAPLEIVKGALAGQKRWGVDIVLTGDETAIRDALKQCGLRELRAVWIKSTSTMIGFKLHTIIIIPITVTSFAGNLTK